MKRKTAVAIAGLAMAAALPAFGDVPADGNRYYDLPRYYESEVSVSGAYFAMEHSRDYPNVAGEPKPVLIDVRSMREYASGHPEDAYNVPFPTVSGMGGDPPQDPAKLYWEVYRIVDGRTDTPIMTLCRTGHRSVLAGNILARPDLYGISGPAFTRVRNIWEGFVGQPKYAFRTGTDQIELDANRDGVIDGPYQLDLNNNGKLDADAADVYVQTKDSNPDKDGWRNFARLPWTTQIQQPLAYERNPGHYYQLNLTPVPAQ